MPNVQAHTKVTAISIIVGTDRVRADFGDLNELAASIRDEGLLQPPVVNQDGVLIAGERRLRAMRDVLGWTEIPVIFFETLDEAHLARLESEENVKRKAPNWKERVLSVDKVHRLNSLNAALNSTKWGQKETGNLLGMSQANISFCTVLAAKLRENDPEISKAESMADGLRILLKRAEDDANKKLVAMTMPKLGAVDLLNTPLSGKAPLHAPANPAAVSTTRPKTDAELDDLFYATAPAAQGMFAPAIVGVAASDEMPGDTAASSPTGVRVDLSSRFINGDGAVALASFPFGSIAHVVCDLPYGIDMDNLLQEQGGQDITETRAGHNIEANLDFTRRVIPAAFDALADGGFFIGFYDLDHHNLIQDLGRKAGFKVQRWPLVWSKTHRCSNQMANFNFTKSHEVAFVFRKGKATLLSPQDRSVWSGSNEAEAKALGHPFAKPFKLWQWIFDAVAQRGQTVFDPCAGRGSSTIAALDRGLVPYGAELMAPDYNALVLNVQNWYRSKDSNVTFA